MTTLPPRIGWMSCHFSPGGPGLIDIPRVLPPESMLILDDRIAATAHEPTLVADQLSRAVAELQCSHVLLDWERPPTSKATDTLQEILQRLPCPVAVTAAYARDEHCAVFLPPVPPHITPEAHLSPWNGREIWLEVALDGTLATVTSEGCRFSPVPFPDPMAPAHSSQDLHCHYHTAVTSEEINFHFYRTREDLERLLNVCKRFGVTVAVGLYQELAYRRNTL